MAHHDPLKQELTNAGLANMQSFFSNKVPNTLNLVLYCMNVVEKMKKEGRLDKMHAYNAAKNLVPKLLDTMLEMKMINAQKHAELLRDIQIGTDKIDEFIPLAIEIAHHPTVVQATEHVTDFLGEQIDKAGWNCCSSKKKK